MMTSRCCDRRAARLRRVGCASTADARSRAIRFEPLQPRHLRASTTSSTRYVAEAGRAAPIDGDVPARSATGVRNFFGNIADLFIGVNNMLQGKFEDGCQRLGALRVQYHFRPVRHPRHRHRHGLSRSTTRTSARPSAAGAAGTGPYLVLPVARLERRARRHRLGLRLLHRPDRRDRSPCRRALAACRRCALIQTRADLLDASRVLEEAALDRYMFLRDAYLQRRRSLVYDGQSAARAEDELRQPRTAAEERTSR